MPLLLDTYNVLHVVGVLPPEMAGVDTQGLIRLIRSSRYVNERVTLVCDGTPGPDSPVGRIGTTMTRYAGPGRSADDLIKQMVARSTAPRRLTVVTSDRQILRAAQKRRCKTLASDDFLRRLVLDASQSIRREPNVRERPGGLSDAQVVGWARVFGIDPDQPPDVLEPEEPDWDVLFNREPASGHPASASLKEDRAADETEHPPVAPESERPRKARAQDPPMIPADLIGEARALVEEEDAPTADRDPVQPAADQDDEPNRTPPREPPDPGAATIPAALIAEAERLLAELEGATDAESANDRDQPAER